MERTPACLMCDSLGIHCLFSRRNLEGSAMDRAKLISDRLDKHNALLSLTDRLPLWAYRRDVLLAKRLGSGDEKTWGRYMFLNAGLSIGPANLLKSFCEMRGMKFWFIR